MPSALRAGCTGSPRPVRPPPENDVSQSICLYEAQNGRLGRCPPPETLRRYARDMSDPWGSTAAKHFVTCHYCDRGVTATEAGRVEDHDPEHGPPSLVTLVRCDQCGQALVFVQEDYGRDEGWDDMFRVWPGAERQLSFAVPSALRDEHEEARACFQAKAYTAAAVMVRRTLEGVCAEHGVKERTLARALQAMHDKDLLDRRLLEWAEALRVLGNAGAHYTAERVKREDAQDALAFAEALLDYLYVLQAKFEEFKSRRTAPSRAPKAGTGQQYGAVEGSAPEDEGKPGQS